MNLHTDGYESVVHDFAVAKIGLIAFASLPDFMCERLQVTMASLQVGFGWLDVGKSGHGVPFKQVIAPETAHSKMGSCWSYQDVNQNDSEQSQKGQQDPKKGARKGCISKGLQSPQEGFTVFAALLVVSVVFCYHFCSWLS